MFWRLRGNPCVRAIKIGLGIGQLHAVDARGRVASPLTQAAARAVADRREELYWCYRHTKTYCRTPDGVRGDGGNNDNTDDAGDDDDENDNDEKKSDSKRQKRKEISPLKPVKIEDEGMGISI